MKFATASDLRHAAMTGNQAKEHSLLNGAQKEATPDSSLIESAVREAFAAVEDVSSHVNWLLQKIEPVCQEQRVGSTEVCGSPGEPKAMPSSLRAHLIQLKGMAEGISARIAAVRHTIEI